MTALDNDKHLTKPPIRILILWNHVEDEDAAATDAAVADAAGSIPSPEEALPGADEASGEEAGEASGDGSQELRAEYEIWAAESDPAMALTAPLAEAAEAAFGARANGSNSLEAREYQIAALADCLRQRAYEVHAFNIEDDCDRIKDAVVVIQPSLVLNLIDQVYGDATHHAAVAGYLELLDVTYVGSEPLCLATCQERVRTHILLRDAGVAVPGFEVIRDINVIPETSALRFPVIVTQAYDDVYEEEGWDNPIHDRVQLIVRSAALFKDYDLPYLIEEFLCQRRLHAVVLGNRVLEILPLVEVDDGGDLQLAITDYDTLDRVHDMARRAFRALGCREFAQVDIHLSADGEAYVVDVRARLELTTESVFWAAAGFAARAREDVLADMVEAARGRGNPAHDASDVEPRSTPAASVKHAGEEDTDGDAAEDWDDAEDWDEGLDDTDAEESAEEVQGADT